MIFSILPCRINSGAGLDGAEPHHDADMTLTVLSDDQIRDLLENLSGVELGEFKNALKAALFDYSTGTQSPEKSPIQQPERLSVHSAAMGATTLFMPSCSSAGHGIKGIGGFSHSHLPLV